MEHSCLYSRQVHYTEGIRTPISVRILFVFVDLAESILPITAIVLETDQFDPLLMKNPALANEKIRHENSKGYHVICGVEKD